MVEAQGEEKMRSRAEDLFKAIKVESTYVEE